MAGSGDLVTGALGFVGLHLVTSLLRDGRTVYGVGRHPAGTRPPERAGDFVPRDAEAGLTGAVRYEGPAGGFTYVPLALEQAAPIRELLARIRVGAVFHLAAQSSAGLSFRDPADTFVSNVQGTLNLLEAVRALPDTARPQLLSIGSSEEYGPQPGERLLDEETPLNPISPYAVSKVAQSLLCRQYARSWGLPVVVARSFSHTGPGQDTRFAFPSFARQIAAAEAGRGPEEVVTGDLSAVRDFLDVRDVVAAYRLLVRRGEPGTIYNVCSGTALTIREGLEILVRGARRPLTIRTDPARSRPSDTPRLVGDNTRLRRATGWQPECSIGGALLGLLEEARREFT